MNGIYLALDLLSQQNKVLAGHSFSEDQRISGKNKRVLVIGGGDTGSDCIGTVRRQGCLDVTQIEIMPKPPVGNNPQTPWPQWPVVLKTTSSHEEGCNRRWLLNTNRFIGKDGCVTGAEVEEISWTEPKDGEQPTMIRSGKPKSSLAIWYCLPWDLFVRNIPNCLKVCLLLVMRLVVPHL